MGTFVGKTMGRLCKFDSSTIEIENHQLFAPQVRQKPLNENRANSLHAKLGVGCWIRHADRNEATACLVHDRRAGYSGTAGAVSVIVDVVRILC